MPSFVNPYADPSTPWLKGNLHTHTTESDGTRAPQAVIDDYAARGYDFLMISDHDKLTPPEKYDAQGMVLIPGNEITAKGPHMLHVNAKKFLPPEEDRQKNIDAILEEKALCVVNHPNWQETFNHCPHELMEKWTGYHGLEVYNGVIRRLYGSPLGSDRWDRLLTKGRKVWGFANDDSHRPEDVELAWNVVQSKDRSVKGIFDALINGRFYGSTGVQIERIEVKGRTLYVRAPNASRIVVVSDHGRRETHVDRPELVYNLGDDVKYSYIRVECYGSGEGMAWTQPFFVKK